MTIKFANQMLLGSNFTTTNKDLVTSTDTVDSAIGKIQSQNFYNGIGSFIGYWDASTNTPTLSNSTIETAGNWYLINVAGEQNLGNGTLFYPAYSILYSDGTQYLIGERYPMAQANFFDWAPGSIPIGQGNGNSFYLFNMTGDVTMNQQGITSFVFSNRLTSSQFDYTIKGGVQYISEDAVLPVDQFVLGRPYTIYNGDTVSHTYTFQYSNTTNTGITLIGGDALTNFSTITQVVDPSGYYTITLQSYDPNTPTAVVFIS